MRICCFTCVCVHFFATSSMNVFRNSAFWQRGELRPYPVQGKAAIWRAAWGSMGMGWDAGTGWCGCWWLAPMPLCCDLLLISPSRFHNKDMYNKSNKCNWCSLDLSEGLRLHHRRIYYDPIRKVAFRQLVRIINMGYIQPKKWKAWRDNTWGFDFASLLYCQYAFNPIVNGKMIKGHF